jgi:hypothetical protein
MKQLTMLAIGLITMIGAGAQATVEFHHSLGAKFYLYPADGAGAGTGAAAIYSPRINILSSRSGALSLGTHAGLGFNINSQSGGALIIDLPLVAEYNFAGFSTSQSGGGFGGYIGAGYGYHRIAVTNIANKITANINGPIFTGGLRFNAGRNARFGSGYEIGASFMPGKYSGVSQNVLGLSFSVLLGKY